MKQPLGKKRRVELFGSDDEESADGDGVAANEDDGNDGSENQSEESADEVDDPVTSVTITDELVDGVAPEGPLASWDLFEAYRKVFSRATKQKLKITETRTVAARRKEI